MLTFPLAPIFTVTRLGTVWPGVKLRFDTTGWSSPEGQAVMKPFVIGESTVTFKTTAVAPVAGTPPTPATFNSVIVLRARPEMLPPVPSRVSISRAGLSGTKKLRVGGCGRSSRTGPDEYDAPRVAPLRTTA